MCVTYFTKFMLFYILKDKENLYIVEICNEITKCPLQGGCISLQSTHKRLDQVKLSIHTYSS